MPVGRGGAGPVGLPLFTGASLHGLPGSWEGGTGGNMIFRALVPRPRITSTLAGRDCWNPGSQSAHRFHYSGVGRARGTLTSWGWTVSATPCCLCDFKLSLHPLSLRSFPRAGSTYPGPHSCPMGHRKESVRNHFVEQRMQAKELQS